MSTSEWLLGLAESLLSPWLVLPALLFLVWLLLALRIGKRHYLNMDDMLPEREEEQEP